MGIIQFVKNLFKRGQYAMTTESLASNKRRVSSNQREPKILSEQH